MHYHTMAHFFRCIAWYNNSPTIPAIRKNIGPDRSERRVKGLVCCFEISSAVANHEDLGGVIDRSKLELNATIPPKTYNTLKAIIPSAHSASPRMIEYRGIQKTPFVLNRLTLVEFWNTINIEYDPSFTFHIE